MSDETNTTNYASERAATTGGSADNLTQGKVGGVPAAAAAAPAFDVREMNNKIAAHPSPTLNFGGKSVKMVQITDDNRLEYQLPDGERQFAALDDSLRGEVIKALAGW